MAKQTSKKNKKNRFSKTKMKLANWKKGRQQHVKLHKSFKRSYREDYQRELEIPGIMSHIMTTFKMIFKNWKLFLPLLIIAVVLNIVLVGLMSESTYTSFQDILEETNTELASGEIGNVAKAGLLLISTVTTGGLSGSSSEAAVVFAVIIFLIIWLTTIFLLRQRMAGHKVKLRDGLYNAMTPLVSTLVVAIVILVQCIPIFLLIIAYSAAVQTGFLATPFYALVFFVFAAAMILLSGYMLSSSVMAMVAVTAPGLYPMRALTTASDLMAGRRIKFIIRLIAGFFALVIVWVVIVLPMILLDMWLKSVFEWLAGFPFVPLVLLIMTCFTAIYLSAYLYIYYRWMLGHDKE